MRGITQLGVGVAFLTLGLSACDDAFDGDELPPPALPCVPTVAGTVGPASSVSFDPNAMLCVRLSMAADDLERMKAENRFSASTDVAIDEALAYLTDGCTENVPGSYTWYRADVDVDGLVLRQVGVRKKGFLGSVLGQGVHKPSIKLKTDKYVAGQLLGDTERITLNNNSQDPRRVNTCLAYEVFAAADYAAPRCNVANVMINDKPFGAYSHVEAIKKPFLKRAFGDDSGSLYEGTIADFGTDFLAVAAAGNLGRWQAKTDDTDPTGAPLRRIRDALKVPDAQLVASLDAVLNLERFMTFWAVEVLINHSDGYAGNRNNFYVYFDPTDAERAVFIPWGPDNVLNDEGDEDALVDLNTFVFGELPRRLSRVPATATRFEEELRRLLEHVWREETLLARIDMYGGQVRSAQDDPEYDGRLATLRSWVKRRRAAVNSALSKGLPRGAGRPALCTEMQGGDIAAGGVDALSIFAFFW